MEHRQIGLRAQDVHSGLQTIDATSGLVAAELNNTRIAGMAATVAANIKGIDVISDERALRTIAAHQWGIDGLVLRNVLGILQDLGYVVIHQQGSKITRIDETVPLLHDKLYATIGEYWKNSDPTELDEASVDSIEVLAEAPMRLSAFEKRYNDSSTVAALLDVAKAAQFARALPLPDGDQLIWSPFCAYEHPEQLGALFDAHSDDDVRKAFHAVRTYQGLPLDGSAAVLSDAVGHGILIANTIKGSGGEASFAFVPYRAASEFRQIKKVVLDKALVLLAAVRYGQHFAIHPIRNPSLILEALADPQRGKLRATSEAKTQYRSAVENVILRLEKVGSSDWYRPVLIDTPDNRQAVQLALDLLEHGEPVAGRDDPDQRLLFTGGTYLTPLMTMKERTSRAPLDTDVLLRLADLTKGEAE